ncbi:Retrovirus-related Pol polyprotein from transposon opus, partial [Mucuna pruriens]
MKNRHDEMLLTQIQNSWQVCIDYKKLNQVTRKDHFLYLLLTRRIEVDKAKVNIIASLPNPTSVREVLSFLRHVGLYRRYIKNFSKIALPLSKLL